MNEATQELLDTRAELSGQPMNGERQSIGDAHHAPAGVAPLAALMMSRQFSADTIREYMALQREHDSDEAKKAYTAAMVLARSAIKPASRTGHNTHLKSSYASLDDLLAAAVGPLAEHGFSLAWKDEQVWEQPQRVRSVCTITHAQGHSESGEFTVPVEQSRGTNTAQQWGIASSYARRYAMKGLLGIATEDSDGRAKAAALPEPEAPAAMTDDQSDKLAALLDAIAEHDAGYPSKWAAYMLDKNSTTEAENSIGMTFPAVAFEQVEKQLVGVLAAKREAAEA